MTTILYAEDLYPDETVEREIYGPEVRIVWRNVENLSDLPATDCAEIDGLMVLRHWVRAADFAKFLRLRCVVRMGVGTDRIDRAAAAERGVMVCNIPDYGTMEVADHALALAIGFRRGLFLHHELQQHSPPEPWKAIFHPTIRRLDVQTFGIIGLGRIGTGAALRAKAFGFRVLFFDPYRPNGTDRALGIARAKTLEELLRQSDVLSLHAPLTPETKGMLGAHELALLPEGAVVVNTARGQIIDIDALGEALRSGRIAAAGLDVLAVEPPVEPVPDLVRAYRAREPWLEGRLVITPHSAFHTPESWEDIRRKGAETIAAALLTNMPQNVVTPDMF